MGSHLKEFVKEFSQCQGNCSNKRDVRSMGSRIIESQLFIQSNLITSRKI